MGKRILILYTSNTVGHKAIGENIGYYLQEAGYQVRLEDVLKTQKGWLVDDFRKLHAWVNAHLPSLWSYLYQSGWFTNLTLKLRIKIAAKNHQQTQNIIEEFKPEVIITTQTTASAIVAYLKQQRLYTGKFGIAFSDYHLHRYWLYSEANFYLVNTPEQKQEMLELGVPEDKVFVCGVMLKPAITVDRDEIKSKFGIKPEEKVVLLASGSLGTGVDENLANGLLAIEGAKLIVVCGNNQKLFQKLINKYQGNQKIGILGFYQNMGELYQIADIFLTKPGGLSIAEALRERLPIIITHMLPGQEELNYIYLMDKGLVMPEPVNIEESVEEELQSGEFKKVLLENPQINQLFAGRLILLQAVDNTSSLRA